MNISFSVNKFLFQIKINKKYIKTNFNDRAERINTPLYQSNNLVFHILVSDT